VPRIILTNDGAPHVQDDGFYILYEYIEGDEAHPMRDAKAVGALVGQLHRHMKEYPGPLAQREEYDFVGKYVELLRERNYPRADAFAAHGKALWAQVRHLPRGYCHGDLYRGNVLKAPGGKLYLLDFDTSCVGFPLYDAALFCNRTDYFKLDRGGYTKSRQAFEQFLPEYRKHHALESADFSAVCDLIGIYHFALQATILELFGPDCVDEAFFDAQLAWLRRWSGQCE